MSIMCYTYENRCRRLPRCPLDFSLYVPSHRTTCCILALLEAHVYFCHLNTLWLLEYLADRDGFYISARLYVSTPWIYTSFRIRISKVCIQRCGADIEVGCETRFSSVSLRRSSYRLPLDLNLLSTREACQTEQRCMTESLFQLGRNYRVLVWLPSNLRVCVALSKPLGPRYLWSNPLWRIRSSEPR